MDCGAMSARLLWSLSDLHTIPPAKRGPCQIPSVGVYQDEQGRTPVLASVKRAEKAILEKQDTKTYVAILDRADARRQRWLGHCGAVGR
jgi:hypothetical protein